MDAGPIETTQYRRAGEIGSVYGVQGESLVPSGLARPRTPLAIPEREGLLGRTRRGSRPRTGSSSVAAPSTGGTPQPSSVRGIFSPISPAGYAPAPTEEVDLADPGIRHEENPFQDPPDTSYDPGAMMSQHPYHNAYI
jgi:hypothetical protein